MKKNCSQTNYNKNLPDKKRAIKSKNDMKQKLFKLRK